MTQPIFPLLYILVVINGKGLVELDMGKKAKNSWTDEEIQFLKDNYNNYGQYDLVEELNNRFGNNRTLASFHAKCSKLKLKKYPSWTEEENNIIKDKYPKCSKEEITELLSNRGWAAIMNQAANIGVKRITSGFTETDDLFIKENYLKMSYKEISNIINKTNDATKQRARKLGLVKINQENIPESWTKEEIDYLKQNYRGINLEEIAEKFNRTSLAIKTKMERLGLYQNRWTGEEVKYLKDNYKIMTDYELSIYLNRETSAIKDKRNKLKLKRTEKIYHTTPWTQLELDILKDNYIDMNDSELSCILKGRTSNAIGAKRQKLGLVVKTKEELLYKDWELEYLMENYADATFEDMVKALNRTEPSIRTTANNLGLKRSNFAIYGNEWTDEQDNFLIENFGRYTDIEFSELLNKSVTMITHRRTKYGMVFSREYFDEDLFSELCESVGYKYLDFKFVEKDYGKLRYVQIQCDKGHPEFWTIYHGVTKTMKDNKNGRCPYCDDESKRKTHEEFEKELFESTKGNIIALSKYIKQDERMSFYCKEHNHEWNGFPATVVRSAMCPKCWKVKGKNERSIGEILETLELLHQPQYKFDGCRDIFPMPFDFYIPEFNCCIEYDGEQHFYPIDFAGKGKEYAEEQFTDRKRKDAIKTKYCVDNDITLIRIPYFQFEKAEEIIIRRLKLNNLDESLEVC